MQTIKSGFRWLGRTTKNLIKEADRVPFPINFSYQDKSEYKSFTGGLLALAVAGFILAVIVFSIREVLDKTQIVAAEKKMPNPDS